jgi:hypothetical protein
MAGAWGSTGFNVLLKVSFTHLATMNRGRKALFVAIAAAVLQTVVLAQNTAGIFIKVHSETGQAIAGVEVRIEGARGSSVRDATNGDGEVRVSGLAAGSYRIIASMDGFEQSSQPFQVQDDRQTIEIDVTLHAKLQRTDQIDVFANSEELDTQQTSAPSNVIQADDVTSLPIRAVTAVDSLPLIPGVNRGPNGEIQISGQGEERSALLVNSGDVTDPATGRFGSTVPLGSVETIDVFKTPFLPEYGKFSTGVVAVSTKRGGEKWRFSVKDPVPDFRVRSGHVRGMRDTVPKISFGGPLIHNKLYISQSADYMLDKRPVRTLSFPSNESKIESVNSFSQFDYILSPRHFITATVHLTPQHTNFVDPQFFNPQPATPSFRGFEESWTLSEHASLSRGLLDSTISHQGFRARIGAQGDADMVLTPTGNRGNYFARRSRDSSRTEWSETLSRPVNGRHNVKLGSVVARTTNAASFSFKPIEVWDQDSVRLQRIEFTGGAPLNLTDVDGALFAQDHWTLFPSLALDGGARAEYQQVTKTFRFAPRVGASWTPLREAHLIVRGGVGVFYDRVPLTIYSFSHYPQQVITDYGPDGEILGTPRQLPNITQSLLGSRFPLLSSEHTSGNFAPYSKTWTAEVEQTVKRSLHFRVGYQHSDSGGVMVVSPRPMNGTDALVLDGNGRSTHRQLEMTARFNWKNGQQMLFSYTRSKTRGDVNLFDRYLSDYPAAFLRPNEFSNVRGDIPNRFLSWGFVNIPWKMRLAPIFEYRTGQPFAVIDAARRYVGIPYHDSTRLLNFLSWDMSISKQIRVLSKHTVRVALTGLNLTNHFNALDVHANTADPQFGVFFGHYKRRYRFDFEVLF